MDDSIGTVDADAVREGTLCQDKEEVGTPPLHDELVGVHILLRTNQEHVVEHGVPHEPTKREGQAMDVVDLRIYSHLHANHATVAPFS